mgnify:CR=1 FL=1
MSGLAPRAIASFRGQYAFLSNFSSSPITGGPYGLTYPTVEHWFQAHKTLGEGDHHWVVEAHDPSQAKYRGKCVRLRSDWEDVKLDIMQDGLWLKFTPDSELAYRLLETEPADLIEGNTWGDRYWGAVLVGDEWVGQNWLGKLLERTRAELGA